MGKERSCKIEEFFMMGVLNVGKENERASRPLAGFGILNDNTIKGLTCLHEFMRRNSIQESILNEMTYVLQASVFIPVTISRHDKQIEKGKLRVRYSQLI